jgi:hypothetical protein
MARGIDAALDKLIHSTIHFPCAGGRGLLGRWNMIDLHSLADEIYLCAQLLSPVDGFEVAGYLEAGAEPSQQRLFVFENATPVRYIKALYQDPEV